MVTEGRRPAAAVAWSGAALTLLLVVAALILSAKPPTGIPPLTGGTVLFALQFLPLVAVGALIAAQRPAQPIGWLLVAIGIAFGSGALLAAGARFEYGPAPVTGALLVIASNQLFKVASVGAAIVLLLFPDGRLPSARWRWLLVVLALLVTTVIAVEVATPGPIADYLVRRPPRNPLGAAWVAPIAPTVSRAGFLMFAFVVIASASSLVIRYRRAGREQRLQLKWFVLAAAIWAATALADGLFRALVAGGRSWPEFPFQIGYLVGATAMAAAIGIAILRHRLFDVELVLSRTVAFGLLAGTITAFYLAVVAGLGTLFATGSPSRLIVAVAVTAVVAVVFQPLRARLERVARRLVYGSHSGSYEVLAEFTESLAGERLSETVIPAMARMLSQGTGCDSATVWVRRSGQDSVAASWPGEAPISGLPVTRSVTVDHGGEVLGRLEVYRRSGEELTPTEERLMDGLATQAGLVLYNGRLQLELSGRVDELQASRQRLVEVQDGERRRLERDIHDGAQQDLVALRLKLGATSARARRGAPELVSELDELQRDLGSALDSLRALARGVYPPLLEAEGLHSALSARARPLPFAVAIKADRRRYPAEIEGAVYFCCAEALQNVAKHAAASRAEISIWQDAAGLHFEVTDNGIGMADPECDAGTGLRHIRDRVEALGGALLLVSSPGAGLVVRGTLPPPL